MTTQNAARYQAILRHEREKIERQFAQLDLSPQDIATRLENWDEDYGKYVDALIIEQDRRIA